MKVSNIIYTLLGHLCVVSGVVGIFVPVLPTTPFLLLAAVLYARGSRRFYNWLINHAHLGKFIRDYREKRGVTLRNKIAAITLVWLGIGSSVIFFVHFIPAKIAMLALAAGVTVFLVLLKTVK